jgi:hypothetical protein
MFKKIHRLTSRKVPSHHSWGSINVQLPATGESHVFALDPQTKISFAAMPRLAFLDLLYVINMRDTFP